MDNIGKDLSRSISDLHIRQIRESQDASTMTPARVQRSKLIIWTLGSIFGVWCLDAVLAHLFAPEKSVIEHAFLNLTAPTVITRSLAGLATAAAVTFYLRYRKLSAGMDAELKQSSRWLSTTLKSLDAALIAVNRDFTIIFMNPVAERQTGWDNERAIGSSAEDVCVVLDPRTGQQILTAGLLKMVIEYGESVHFEDEYRLQSAMGDEINVIGTASPIKEGSETLGAVIALYDITELKATQEQNTLLATVVTEADEIIVISDDEGRVEYVSPSFRRITGNDPSGVIGCQVDVLMASGPDQTFSRQIEHVLHEGEARRYRYGLTGKGGEKLQFDCRISQLRDNDGNVQKNVYISRDVTRELELQGQVGQSQKMEAMGRMASSVAHDMNNMLNAIGMYNQLSRTSSSNADKIIANADKIENIISKSSNLVNQLLTFSRKRDVQEIVVNVNDTIREDESMLRHLVKKTIELKLDLKSTRFVRIDAGQFSQALMNLVINASDAMDGNGIISIASENAEIEKPWSNMGWEITPGPYVCVSVADNGPGIDERTQSRIFEPFFTTKAEGKGTGLGLAIVYGFIKQVGGDIRLRSVLGEGTTFSLYLPDFKQRGSDTKSSSASADAVNG